MVHRNCVNFQVALLQRPNFDECEGPKIHLSNMPRIKHLVMRTGCFQYRHTFAHSCAEAVVMISSVHTYSQLPPYFFVNLRMHLLIHSPTQSLTHSHTLSLSHSHTLVTYSPLTASVSSNALQTVPLQARSRPLFLSFWPSSVLFPFLQVRARFCQA